MEPNTDDQRFALLLAEADRVGWPRHYKADLYTHDRRALEAIPVETPFVWILRESGTHLYAIPDSLDAFYAPLGTHDWLRAHTTTGEQALCFLYDPGVPPFSGPGLRRVGCIHAAIERAVAIAERRAELRTLRDRRAS